MNEIKPIFDKSYVNPSDQSQSIALPAKIPVSNTNVDIDKNIVQKDSIEQNSEILISSNKYGTGKPKRVKIRGDIRNDHG